MARVQRAGLRGAFGVTVIRKRDGKLCVGFTDDGKAFPCPNEAGTPWTPLWCLPCDQKRRERITCQLHELRDSLS